VRESIAYALGRGKLTTSVREQLNLASVILALRVRADDKEFDGILAGDIDGPGFCRALKIYCEINDRSDDIFPLDVVKVAHHASLDSHKGSNVVLCRKSEMSIAAISAGHDSRVLPDREVIAEFLKAGWVVLLTNKRGSSRPIPDSPLTLSGVVEGTQCFDLKISWSDAEGLRWAPSQSRITVDELQFYNTAA